MTKAVEEVAASLVREYLSRKGLKKTLMCIDDELPRTDSSINNRTDLRQILHLEALYKKNKLQEFPLKSMLEMMVKEHMGNDGNMSPNYSNEQQTFLKKSHSAVLCKVHDVSDDEKNKHRTGNNPDLLQHKQFLAQTSETYHTKQQKASLSCSLTSEGEQNTHQVSLSPEICSISSNAAQSLKNNTTDIRKNRTSHIMRGMMAGPTASFKQECHKKKETRKFCGSSLPETKDEVSKFDMTLSAELSITEVREYPAQLALGGTSKKQESTQENGRLPGLSADATHIHEKLLSNFEKLNTDDRNNRPQMKKCWAKKEIPTPGPKALSLHLKADLMLDDFNDEEDLHEMFAGPVISCNLQTKADLHPIDQKTAVALKELLFGSQLSCFNEEWKAQSFTFSDVHDLRYGIEQKKGGPCGVLASIQACVLQKLLFDGTSSGSGYQKLHPSDAARSKSLLLAIAEILWRSGERKRATVALFSGRKQFVPAGKYKSDGVLETVV